jgi:hypothetical protein
VAAFARAQQSEQMRQIGVLFPVSNDPEVKVQLTLSSPAFRKTDGRKVALSFLKFATAMEVTIELEPKRRAWFALNQM